MVNNLVLVLIVVLVLGVIAVWWVIKSTNNRVPLPSPQFNSLKVDFSSHPPDLWMTDNLDRFGQELSNSAYWYRILDSTGHVIYSNRLEAQVVPEYQLKDTTEVIAASSLGEFGVYRQEMRHLAIRVTDKKSGYRIVHITAAGL